MEQSQDDNHDDDHIEELEDEEEEDQVFNEKLQCRMYRKDFPEESDLVIVIYFLLKINLI